MGDSMRLSHRILSCLVSILMFGCSCASETVISVASEGETLLVTTASKLNIQVKLRTREVEIGKPSDPRPPEIQSSCTYSKFPCSLVDSIEISVNGAQLFIPHSVGCNLADLNRVGVEASGEGAVLTLYGGDASESYIMKIEFDGSGVRRKILSSAMSSDQPLEDTTYHIQVLGD